MNTEAPIEYDTLHATLLRAREQRISLDRNLGAVDAQLAELADEHARYDLLRSACVALAKLGELGAGALFWGEQFAGAKSEEHLRRVGARLEIFTQQWTQLEAGRAAVLEQIGRLEEEIELVEEELFQAHQREERRRLEWIVEREISALPARQAVMPWIRGGEDDRRFRKTLGAALLASLLVGVLVPFIELPLPEPGERVEVPERLARLVEQRLPRPPVVAELPAEPEPETTPEPVEVVEPSEEKPAVATVPTPAAAPTPRRQAESAGILAFREKFSGLADSRPAALLGADARISGAGAEASGRPERSMVTTQAPGSSGGINLASLSRGGGGGGGELAGVAVTRAASAIGGGGADRPRAGGGGATAGRTDEEIQIVFDRHKAALYRLYNRELRRDPTLRGQLVLRLRIEPDGHVSWCELQASDMHAPELAAQVVERIMSFNFGAKEVPPLTILYPIDFLPAG